jgi:DNA-binding transcriptional MocR family regulator
MPDQGAAQTIELGVNYPPAYLAAEDLSTAMIAVARSNELASLANYQPHTGRWEHREAGAAWIRRRGLDATTDRVLLTSGAEHAICASLMAFADPGDTVLVEELTWSGVRALSSLLRLPLKPIPMDEEGLIPEALEMACRSTGARILYTTPTIHNPTTRTLSDERRRKVAAICREWGVTIIEDDIYGFLADDPPPPIASYAPERSIYISAASKSMAPALRIGFTLLPEDKIGRFSAAARATNWMAPPIMAEIATRWITDGTAAAIGERIRQEARARQRVAARVLQGFSYLSAPSSFHIWLSVPEPWRVQDVIKAAARRGLSLVSPELFVPGRAEAPHALRITLTGAADAVELERGLHLLGDLLQSDPDLSLAA